MNRAILVTAMMVLSWHVALADDVGGRAADEAAIRKAVRSYVVAFQHGDAKAVARHWSAEGVYVTPSGQRFQGREALEKEFAAYFAESSGRRIEIGNPAIRFLTADVAVEEGTARVSRRGEPPTDTSYLAIHVRQGDAWKMDSVRETVVPPPTVAPRSPQAT